MTVDPRLRHTRSHPCTICGQWDNAKARGTGERCWGFLSSDGEYEHCTNTAYPHGPLEMNPSDESYAHKLAGECRCGASHGGAEISGKRARTAKADPAPRVPGVGDERLGKAVDGYVYRDERKTVLYTVVRYEQTIGANTEKTFRPWEPAVPNPEPFSRTKAHWVIGNLGRKVLYRLPEVIAAPKGTIIWLAEGEKDANRLVKGGLCATTNPNGAKHWDDSYAFPLKGRHVVILADNDKAGLAGRDRKVKSLESVGCTVQSLTFGEYTENGGADVSDWLDAGHTIDELVAMVQVPERVDDGKPHPIALPDLMAMEFPPLQWAIEGLLPEGTSLLIGKPKSGKSLLALHVGLAIAQGGYALGNIPVEKGEVLYLALEDSLRRLQSRLGDMLPPREPRPTGFFFETKWPRVGEGAIETLDEWLALHPSCRLVIIDTKQRIKPLGKTNGNLYDEDYDSVAPFMDLAVRRHCAIIIVHHSNRRVDAEDPFDTISGSNALYGAVDGAWVFQRSQTEQEAVLYVKHREGDERTIQLIKEPTDLVWRIAADSVEEYQASKEQQAIMRLLKLAGDGMAPRDIAESIGKAPGTVRVALLRMRKSGLVVKNERDKYTIAPNAPSASTASSGGTPEGKVLDFPNGSAKNGVLPGVTPGVTDEESRRYRPGETGFDGEYEDEEPESFGPSSADDEVPS